MKKLIFIFLLAFSPLLSLAEKEEAPAKESTARKDSIETAKPNSIKKGNSDSIETAKLDSIEKALEKNLDEVVVTGTRTPKLLKDSPILTRVITSADIRKSDATNIADLLQSELPGIEFSYSMNQQVSLNMQGFGGNSILFLIDGERVAGETLDNVDYNRLNLNNAGKVEIVKGGASSLYGSNAVGGVVNIISREATEPWTLNINGRYGEHNSQRYGLNFGFNVWKISSVTSAQFTRINTYDMKNGGDFSKVYGGETWNANERLTIRPIDALKIVARAGFFYRQRFASASSNDRYRDFSGGLRGVYDFSPSTNLELSYSFDQYDKSDYYFANRLDIRDYSNVQHIGKLVFNHTFAGKHILTIGGDVMRDYLMSYQFTDGGSHKQITADGFAQIDLNFWKNFNIIAGGRYDYFSESNMQHLSSRVSAMLKINPFTLRACYSGGFRAPTLKEMYMNFDMAGIFMIYGNPDLKPEVSNNFQLSGEFTKGRFNATLGAFCNLVDDRMTTAWSQALNGQTYINISHVTIAGIDANASYKTPWGLGARLSYIYTYEHVKHGEPYTSSTRPHTATVRVDYTKSWKNYSLMVALSGRVLSDVTVDEFTSMTDYSETERVRYPGYTMWKLNMTHSFWRGIDLILTIDNLFNYVPKYNYSSTPSTTGISFSAGLSLDIDRMVKNK